MKNEGLRIRRNDILLVAFIFLIITIFWAYNYLSSKSASSLNSVNIYVSDELYGTYRLDTDKEIDISVNGNICNRVTIKNGRAYMTYATCPDGLCLKQKHISHNNESICCLPNRVLVILKSSDMGDYDAITQ